MIVARHGHIKGFFFLKLINSELMQYFITRCAFSVVTISFILEFAISTFSSAARAAVLSACEISYAFFSLWAAIADIYSSALSPSVSWNSFSAFGLFLKWSRAFTDW